MYGSSSNLRTNNVSGTPVPCTTPSTASYIRSSLVKDIEVDSPPDDSISALKFSPSTLQQNYLIAGSWDSSVRCWEVDPSARAVPKSMKTMGGPVLDVCWSDDGSKVFMAACDKQVKCWDLASDQVAQVAQHDAPIKTCHWIKDANYTCLMTGSWDKTLKFWDTRSPNPITTITLPERCYCADVDYPLAVVGTAGRHLIIYSLENRPIETKREESPLTCQTRAIAIFRDRNNVPTGYALGSTEGRVAIRYVTPADSKDNFIYRCHRINTIEGIHWYPGINNILNIYAVNDIAFHPVVHGTLATVGSDGSYCFWNKDVRAKLKDSGPMDQSITKCCFNSNGRIFAYAIGYDWSKGHEYYNPSKKPAIFLRSCYEELKQR